MITAHDEVRSLLENRRLGGESQSYSAVAPRHSCPDDGQLLRKLLLLSSRGAFAKCCPPTTTPVSSSWPSIQPLKQDRQRQKQLSERTCNACGNSGILFTGPIFSE